MTQERIGRYNILGEIASGGQGAVFRAFDPEAGRLVAIKILHASLTGDRSYLERFRREASITAAIVHPNVVRIFEIGESEGRHFMALEFLPENLARLIQVGGLPAGRAATLAAQIADGLGAAHTRGVVHRDMKPQNVLVTPEGAPKVTDFGIARGEALATMTATGVMMGTPYYMSPEQARGERATPRSDIYSLGCVLYQMLTGELPFQAETPLAILRQHTDDQPRPVRLLRSDIPLPLAAVVERAMEKDPEARFADGDDMAAAIRSAVPGIEAAAEVSSEEGAPAPPPITPPPPPPPPPRAQPTPPPPPPAPAAEPPPPVPPEPAGVGVGETPPPRRPHRSRWWLGVIAIIAVIAVVAVVATQFGGDEPGSGTPAVVEPRATATPRPLTATTRPERPRPATPTPTPAPVLKAIMLGPDTDPGEFFSAIPASERDCASAAVGRTRFQEFMEGANLSDDEGRAMFACLSALTWARVYAGAFLGDAADVSPQTIACMAGQLEGIDLLALMTSSVLSDEEAFVSFVPVLLCLNEAERAAMERSGAFPMPAGVTLEQVLCLADAVGPGDLEKLAYLGEGGEMPAGLLSAAVACGLDRIAMASPTPGSTATRTPTPTPRRVIVTAEPRPLPTRTPTPTPRPTATPAPTPVRDWQIHGDPDAGFEVAVPADWTILDEDETAAVVGPTGFFAALDEEEGARSGFTPNVNMLFEVLSDPISLDEYVEQAVDDLLSAFGGYVGIGHSRTTLQDGEAGVVNYDAGGVAGTQYLLLQDGVGFVITCTASLDQAERYAPVFEQIAGSFKLFLPEEPTPTPTPAAGPEETDLGTVAYYEAPKTWTIDIPGDFTRVEVGTYGEGSDVVNKYGGWNAWLNVNDNRAWEFLTFDPERGGIIYDYILDQEVLETSGKDQYLDATAAFRAGTNTLTYYHFTDGAIGVKVRIWRAGTPTPTPTPLPQPTATPTPAPTSTPTPRPTPTPTPTRTPRPLPDLVPYRPDGWSAPLVHRGTPMAGVPLSVDFAIRNTASVYANDQFDVVILVDGSMAFRLVLPELARDEDYRKIGAEITAADEGPHLVELVVDWQDDVREADETNNSYATVIEWGNPLVVKAGSPQTIGLGATYTTSGASVQSSNADDNYSAIADWGDGGDPEPVSVVQATGEIIGAHVYAVSGVYTITISVTNQYGEEGSAQTSVSVTP